MAEGVQGSHCVVLFLSAGVLLRPYVQLEIGEAVKCGRPVLLMHEADERHHPFNFGTELEEAPSWMRDVIESHESIPWRRRNFERKGVLDMLITTAGFSLHWGGGADDGGDDETSEEDPKGVLDM